MEYALINDVVKDLGYLALGTRLKRIGDTLQAQAQSLLAARGLDIPAAHFPLLAALDRLGALSVGALGTAVGVSQPVVSRSLLGLQSNGWVESLPMAGDRRMHRIRLSRKGRALVRHARSEVWPVIEAAVTHACEPLEGPLLDQLSALEASLAKMPLLLRATAASVSTPRPGRRRPN